MKIRHGFEGDDERLAETCHRYEFTELAFFGSVLRESRLAGRPTDVVNPLAEEGD